MATATDPLSAALALAHALVQRGARLAIVHYATGLPRARLKALYRVHGRPAPTPGQMRATTAGVLATRERQLHASLVASLYARLGGDGIYADVCMEALLRAYDLYLELVPLVPPRTGGPRAGGPGARAPGGPLVNMNDSWILARDLRVGLAVLSDCPICRSRFVIHEDSRVPPNCPICALRARTPGRRRPLIRPDRGPPAR